MQDPSSLSCMGTRTSTIPITFICILVICLGCRRVSAAVLSNHRQWPRQRHDPCLSGIPTSSARTTNRSTLHAPNLQESQAREAASCDPAAFSDLYQTIDADLSHWQESGITQLLMDQSLAALSGMMCHRGIAIMFEAGVAYIIRWATCTE